MAHLLAGEHIGAAVITIEDAEDVEQRGLTRSRRAHDGNQLTLAYGEINALQHMQGLVTGAVVLVDALQFDHVHNCLIQGPCDPVTKPVPPRLMR